MFETIKSFKNYDIGGPKKGITLIALSNSSYKVSAPHRDFHCSGGELAGVFRCLEFDIASFEFSISDLSLALREMEKNNHNVAYFGIFGGFLFSKYVD